MTGTARAPAGLPCWCGTSWPGCSNGAAPGRPRRSVMSKVRAALVGCGKVGHIHAAALQALTEADLVGVCDTSGERAGAFAARYGGRPFTEVAAMLREARPEAV